MGHQSPCFGRLPSSGYLRGLLIQWSVKVECWMADSILGMWQVVQFFVLTGQAAPDLAGGGESAAVFAPG